MRGLSPMPESSNVSPLAGKPAPQTLLVDVPRLVTAYFADRPDPSVPGQRVAFGTSGHRGSAFDRTFNEWHVLAISQAICEYRKQQGINGPLFLGVDTHALSTPAAATALEVLAANGVEVMLAEDDDYTPTPVISHAILNWNRGRTAGWRTALSSRLRTIRPESGGFKYNPPHGGPADSTVTGWIEVRANAILAGALQGVAVNDPGSKSASRAPPRTGTIIAALTSAISATSSTWPRFAARSCAWAWIRWAAPACTTGRQSRNATAGSDGRRTKRSIRRSAS